MLLSRFPYPLEKGDKLRAYYQIQELSKNHEIILCALTDQKVQKEWVAELEKYCHSLHVFSLKKVLMYWNTAKQVFTSKPYQTGYFYQAWVRRKVQEIIEKEQPDHIYCQLIRTTEYVKNLHSISKTLDYMDALSKGMFRRAEMATGLKKRLIFEEGKRLAEYEHRIFDYFNHHTIISEQDRAFISHPQKEEITIIENGIADAFTNYNGSVKKDVEIVFTGNMNYPPNIACCEYLIFEILPLLKKRMPEVRVLLSGANPHQRVKTLANDEAVTVTGWVEDIRDSYARAHLFVAPLFIGTGLQNKLLEAMAMGIPAITTPLANNALQAEHASSVMIASNAEQFADQIFQLLEDEVFYGQIAKKARQFVAEKYSWEGSVKKLVKVMGIE
jgi:sugar transferase (PEP-CTERM/EpsH1 system associated)